MNLIIRKTVVRRMFVSVFFLYFLQKHCSLKEYLYGNLMRAIRSWSKNKINHFHVVISDVR